METLAIEELLHDYFIQNNTVTLPGIGTFHLVRISAMVDFASRKMNPPSFTVRFDHRNDTVQRALFEYIAHRGGVPEWDAIRAVNQFAFDMKSKLSKGEPFTWERMGTLKPDAGFGYQFDPERLAYDFNRGVSAVRVIREGSEHAVLVGDEERTNTEMEELLARSREGSRGTAGRIWLQCLLIAASALLIIALRAFTDDISVFSPRFDRIVSVEAPATYTIQTQP